MTKKKRRQEKEREGVREREKGNLRKPQKTLITLFKEKTAVAF